MFRDKADLFKIEKCQDSANRVPFSIYDLN